MDKNKRTQFEKQITTLSLAQMYTQKNTLNGKLFIRNTTHTHSLPELDKYIPVVENNDAL